MWRFWLIYIGGAVVHTFPLIISLQNWLIDCCILSPCLLPNLYWHTLLGMAAIGLQQNISDLRNWVCGWRTNNKGVWLMLSQQSDRGVAADRKERHTHTMEFPPGEGHPSDSNSCLQCRSGAQCPPADECCHKMSSDWGREEKPDDNSFFISLSRRACLGRPIKSLQTTNMVPAEKEWFFVST